MDMFFGILFILFMFIGVLFSVYAVFYHLLKPKNKRSAVVVLLDSNSPDIQKQLGFIEFQCAAAGSARALIIDNGMNNVQRAFCEQFCEENPYITLIFPDEITEVL